MPAPTVSIIICHHTGDLIHRCLESVALSRGLTWETLVVTSVSTLAVRNPDYSIKLLYEPGGPAHKRNVGVRQAKGEYLVFLDDDVEVSPYTLHELVKALQDNPQIGMGFAKILNMERRQELDRT